MKETEILRGLGAVRAKMALPNALTASYFNKGTPFVKGKHGKDKVPAMLTHGEAVLPVQTVKKLGAQNIARLIADTNSGKQPAQGLRAGGHYINGVAGAATDDYGVVRNAISQAAKVDPPIMSSADLGPVENAPAGSARTAAPKFDIPGFNGYQSASGGASAAGPEVGRVRGAWNKVTGLFNNKPTAVQTGAEVNQAAGDAALQRSKDVLAGRTPTPTPAPGAAPEVPAYRANPNIGGVKSTVSKVLKPVGGALDAFGSAAKFLGPVEALGKTAYVARDALTGDAPWSDVVGQGALGLSQNAAQTAGLIGGGMVGGPAAPVTALAGGIGARMATDAAYDAARPEGSPFQQAFERHNPSPEFAPNATPAQLGADNTKYEAMLSPQERDTRALAMGQAGMNAAGRKAALDAKYAIDPLTSDQVAAQKAVAPLYGSGDHPTEQSTGIRENTAIGAIRNMPKADQNAAYVAQDQRMHAAKVEEARQQAASIPYEMAKTKDGRSIREYNDRTLANFAATGRTLGLDRNPDATAAAQGRAMLARVPQMQGANSWALADGVKGGTIYGSTPAATTGTAGLSAAARPTTAGVAAGSSLPTPTVPYTTPQRELDAQAKARTEWRGGKAYDPAGKSLDELRTAHGQAVNAGDIDVQRQLKGALAEKQAQYVAELQHGIQRAQFSAGQRKERNDMAVKSIHLANPQNNEKGEPMEITPKGNIAQAQINRVLATHGKQIGVPDLRFGDLTTAQQQTLIDQQKLAKANEEGDASLLSMITRILRGNPTPMENQDITAHMPVARKDGFMTSAGGDERRISSTTGSNFLAPLGIGKGGDAQIAALIKAATPDTSSAAAASIKKLGEKR